MFRPPESRFPRFLENLFDGSSFAPLDSVVQVFELPAQLSGQELSDAGLTRAHEANQNHRPEFARTMACRRSSRHSARKYWKLALLEVDFTTEGTELYQG